MEIEKDINWYEILECSINSTKEQIEKSARQLARKYHPDRNKDPHAIPLFLNVQKAKEFLLDDNKRKEYDEKIKKVIKRKEYDHERSQHMDSKRKKMREDLEARLGKVQKTTTTSTTNMSNETETHQNKRKERNVDDIRRDGINRMNEAREKQEAAHDISVEEILKHRQSMTDPTDLKSNVQIKVKWRRTDISHSDESLCSLFRVFGHIEDILMSAGGKPNSAIITFESHEAAQTAIHQYAESTLFKVAFVTAESKKASIFTHTYRNTTTGAGPTQADHGSTIFTEQSNGDIFSNTPIASNSESDLMKEVRRAVEREQLLKEMAQSMGSSAFPTEPGVTSTPINSSFISFSSLPSSNESARPSHPPINLAAKENDILARMMAAKKMKAS